MKKILKLCGIIFIAPLFSNVAFANGPQFTSTIDVINCPTISYNNYDCGAIFVDMRNYNSANRPNREKVIVGWRGRGGDFFQIKQVHIETRVYGESDDRGDVPQAPRPDVVYHDPESPTAPINNPETTNLEDNISEGVNSRMKDQLQVGLFQYKKGSCSDTSKNGITRCYTTSKDGAIKKIGDYE